MRPSIEYYLIFPNLAFRLALDMSQLSKRELVMSLLKAQRLSAKEISENVGVSLATVYNVKARLAGVSTLAHSKGAGRPKTYEM